MYQIVQIGDKEIPMLAMASCDLYYRQIFHDDPIKLQAGKDVSEGDMIELLERMGRAQDVVVRMGGCEAAVALAPFELATMTV